MTIHRPIDLSRPISRKNFLRAGILAASSVAVAGCGSYSNSQAGSSSSAATSGSSSAASSGDATKITFCLDYTPNTNHTGIYVAQDQGYFKDEGLDVTIVQPADDTAETMIGTGQAQFGISYQDYIANTLASDNPMPLHALAAVIQHNTSGIMSRQADGITHPAAMQGHKYATWDMPVEQATVKQIVEKDGGDWSKVELVPYTVDDEVSGLKSNMFDTVWVYEGWAVQNAAVQNYPINYFSFISIDDTFDYYTPVVAGNDDFVKKNPDITKAFIRACKKGYEFAVDKPDDAADILCKQVPELDSALVKKSAEYLAGQYINDASSWGVIDPDRWKKFYQWLDDNDLVNKQLDVNAGYDTQYLEA